jgi:basic membrane protein A
MALAAAVLSSALVLAGCARETSAPPATGGDGAAAAECARNPAPAAAGGAAASAQPETPNADASRLRVGLAYDIGGRGDQSFNDAAYAGLERAITELGVVRDNVRDVAAGDAESEDAKVQRLTQLVNDGYNPVIAVGFAYATAVRTVATANPGVQFAIVDDASITLPNVTGLVFAEEQGSFLVGVAAALKTQDCHIGFVGGVETPLIQRFQAGYEQGARSVAPDIRIESDYISPAGDFSGFNDAPAGAEVAQGQLDRGADVIYQAAGASGQGVFQAVAAANTAEAPKAAIGVDSDQFNTVDPPTNEVIITSMLKRVDVAVFSFINAVAANDTSTIPDAFDLSVDGVGYSTTGGKVTDIVGDLDAWKAEIISGEITVETVPVP